MSASLPEASPPGPVRSPPSPPSGPPPQEDPCRPIPDPLLPHDHLHVTPSPDPVIDALGHDPRSLYVETFSLGILGPSSTWLMRRLAAGLDAAPDGFDLPLAETARALGLGYKNGTHSPLVRSLTRCCQFKLAQLCGGNGFPFDASCLR